MSGDERADGGASDIRRAILAHLHRNWPDPVDLGAGGVSADEGDTAFVKAAVALQDEGLIMYEALLIGAGPSPTLVGALLTRKGQSFRD